MEMYTVGGCVRDEFLGVASKDIDFTVVLPPVEGDPFRAMVNRLKMMGFKIFLETPEYLTVRAQFPKGDGGFDVKRMGGPVVEGRKRLTADFVLARKESDYADGRRPDKVEVGTLMDDLARRDFTMNAIAKAADGRIIDPFNGVEDINERIIRAVGDPLERLTEDALRAVRALRFAVTKDFVIDGALDDAMREGTVKDAVRNKISDERIQVELSKMFRYDTPKSLRIMNDYKGLTDAIFAGSVSLDATLKQRGRGK